VLGPASYQSSSRAAAVEVAPEMAVDRQKSQEGSGVLCVKVMTDGPTRVLQITDVTQQVCTVLSLNLHRTQLVCDCLPHQQTLARYLCRIRR